MLALHVGAWENMKDCGGSSIHAVITVEAEFEHM